MDANEQWEVTWAAKSSMSGSRERANWLPLCIESLRFWGHLSGISPAYLVCFIDSMDFGAFIGKYGSCGGGAWEVSWIMGVGVVGNHKGREGHEDLESCVAVQEQKEPIANEQLHSRRYSGCDSACVAKGPNVDGKQLVYVSIYFKEMEVNTRNEQERKTVPWWGQGRKYEIRRSATGGVGRTGVTLGARGTEFGVQSSGEQGASASSRVISAKWIRQLSGESAEGRRERRGAEREVESGRARREEVLDPCKITR